MSEESYSDVYDDDYDQEPAQASGPKALRDAYEKEKAERKALEERLAKLEQSKQSEELASALKANGVNPKVASLAMKAGVTPDKVGEWIQEYGDVFGIQSTEGEGSEAGGGVDPETQAAIAAVSGAPTGTVSASSGDEVSAMQSIDNEQDFWAFIKSKQ